MKIKLSGIVHSLDPIFSPKAYAKAVFGANLNQVSFKAVDKELQFEVIQPVVSDGNDSINDITDGLIVGDYTNNVQWNLAIV